MSTFVNQVGGDHYQKPIQVWDFVVANKIGFLEGNVIKYVERWERKDGLKDLEKARSYIDKLIAVEKARLEANAQEPVKKVDVLTPAPAGWWNHVRGMGMPDRDHVHPDDKLNVVMLSGLQHDSVYARDVEWHKVNRWKKV
jgi:hypothetical protein